MWNKETGERTRASDELLERARGGGVVKEVWEEGVLGLLRASITTSTMRMTCISKCWRRGWIGLPAYSCHHLLEHAHEGGDARCERF